MGIPKNAGWFISWKTPSFEMDDDWGYPYDSGKYHVEEKMISPVESVGKNEEVFHLYKRRFQSMNICFFWKRMMV